MSSRPSAPSVALAYTNVCNLMRTLAMLKTAERYTLTSVREKPIKIGARCE
jgi:hypothetical protein